MLPDLPPTDRRTLSADKNYDTREFIATTRRHGITPHVAQYPTTAHRRSAIDGRTTRHAGYTLSQQKRKLVEQRFGWMKTVGVCGNFIIAGWRSRRKGPRHGSSAESRNRRDAPPRRPVPRAPPAPGL
jgi:hypothetical protein